MKILNLTDGEMKISANVASGLTNKEISKKLNLSEHTIKSYLEDIYGKLDLHNRVQLAVWFVRNNENLVNNEDY